MELAVSLFTVAFETAAFETAALKHSGVRTQGNRPVFQDDDRVKALMRFTYQSGAQPLTGYTIQRGIHRGGFGEVYYANSSGGKEVALKLLHQDDRDVEIRGVTQCLNLKHPNLVNLFDLKTDSSGDHWVVMEYVAGSSLEDVLETFPDGLPLNEVRDWLSGLVSGVAFLHDKGIVHRDLKPANVYRENGVVKVGDVGLSKRLNSDCRRQHTQSVGTVYYMAPEVAHGQYGPEVDVYSLAVMLYEMITGRLPFDGETTAEILMKHLTAQPDLSPIPAPLRPMLARALEKDPRKRTPTVRQLEREFRQASEALDPRLFPTNSGPSVNGRNSTNGMNVPVGHRFAHSPLSAQPIAAHRHGRLWFMVWFLAVCLTLFISVRVSHGHAPWARIVGPVFGVTIAVLVARFIQRHRDTSQFVVSASAAPPPPPVGSRRSNYHVPAIRPWSQIYPELVQSLGLAAILACLMSAGIRSIFIFKGVPLMPGIEHVALFAAVSIVGSWIVLINNAWTLNSASGSHHRWLMRLVVGSLIGLAAFGLDQFLLADFPRVAYLAGRYPLHRPVNLLTPESQPTLFAFVCFFAAFFALRSWSRMTNPYRKAVFSVSRTVAAGIVALLIALMFRFPHWYGLLWALTMTATVQLASPWVPPQHRAGDARS